MATLYVRGEKCRGSGSLMVRETRSIEKRRRTDRPGSLLLGCCPVCGSWIAVNRAGGLRPHRKVG